MHDAVDDAVAGGGVDELVALVDRLGDRLLGVDVLARRGGLEDRLLALAGDLGVEVDRGRILGQRSVQVRGPVGDVVLGGHPGQLLGVAAQQHRLHLEPGAVGQGDAAVVADGEDGAQQVLAIAHPAGDAVHEDAIGRVGHGGSPGRYVRSGGRGGCGGGHRGRAGQLGIAEQLVGRARDVHPAEVEDTAEIGGLERSAGVLLDEQHGGAGVAHPHDLLEDGAGGLRVEAHRRLVEEHHLRADHQRAGELDLLLLATREGTGEGAPAVCDDGEEGLDEVDAVGHDRLVLDGVGAEHHVLGDGHLLEDAVTLQDVGEPRGQHLLRRVLRDVLPGDLDGARTRGQHAAGDLEDGGLAGAVGADEADDRPRWHLDGQAAQHQGRPAVAGLDVGELEQEVVVRCQGRPPGLGGRSARPKVGLHRSGGHGRTRRRGPTGS